MEDTADKTYNDNYDTIDQAVKKFAAMSYHIVQGYIPLADFQQVIHIRMFKFCRTRKLDIQQLNALIKKLTHYSAVDVIKFYKREKRDSIGVHISSLSDRDWADFDLPSDMPGPLEQAQSRESLLHPLLLRCIHLLSAYERQVLVSYCHQGKKSTSSRKFDNGLRRVVKKLQNYYGVIK